MDRQEVSEKLNEMREIYKYSWFDVSLKSEMQLPTIYQVVKCASNYFVDTLFRIFNPFRAKFVLIKDNVKFEIFNTELLTKWIVYSRERSKMNISEFSIAVGLTRDTVRSYSTCKTKMRIDSFFKWCEVTGYKVNIEYHSHPDIL